MKWIPTLILVFSLSSCARATDDSLSKEQAKAVMEAYQQENWEKVITMTEDIPEGSSWERVRGASLQQRGVERFFAADIEGAISDFDGFLELYPEEDPHHWQRGLAYYYAEEYEKGKQQFERHQTVNTQDVENAVWHFLCVVRTPEGNVETAKAELIPIERDSRIPMAEVHDLFAGRGTVEDVLEAALPDNDGELSETEKNHLCYAHLYLGLYFEALGNEEKMKEHIRLAAFDYKMDHYMGKTAQVHAKLRGVGQE
jgi:lipoprotein NlpI